MILFTASDKPRNVMSVPACGEYIAATLLPDAGAGVDADGRCPHFIYSLATSEWSDVSIPGTATGTTQISPRFDVGWHWLPFEGSLAVIGGSGVWKLEVRRRKIVPAELRVPRVRWLRTYVGGSGASPVAASSSDWQSWAAASEPVIVSDALGNRVVLDHVPIQLQGTFTFRDTVYFLTGSEF